MKVLVAFLVVLLLCLVGFGGYYVYQEFSAPPSASASSSAARPSGPSFGAEEIPETEYDVQDSLDAAIEMNRDTVAWLEVPGTEISNSVLQSLDNEFYLRRDESKEYEVYGCYFADYECSFGKPEDFSLNTVIYGHSNTDKDSDPTQKRFSQLFNFLDLDFARETPYVYLTTPDGKTAWEVFAAFYTSTKFDYIQVHIGTADMLQIAKRGKSLSTYKYDVDLNNDTKILTLSTCSVKYQQDGNGRFVVMARLVPEGEDLVKEARIKG